MCTASWIREAGRFELFFNRDEQRTRAAALPPTVVELGDLRAVMPIDGQDHGTWIAANACGLVVALLNLYEVDYRPERPTSRGHLVRALAGATSLAEARQRLAGEPVERMRAFTVAVFAPPFGPSDLVLFTWDGVALAENAGAVEAPLVSSGRELPRVRAARLAAWQELVLANGGPTAERLERFHTSRLPEPGLLAVAMEREDACTVSLTRVRVDAREVVMTYRPGLPPSSASATTVAIARRGACAP